MLPKIGPELSPKVLERVAQLETEILELRTQLGLPKSNQDERVDELVNLSEAEFNAMTAEECEEASFVLNRHAYNIQTELNKWQGLAVWCTNNIRFVIADKTPEHASYSYDERKYLMMKTIPVAREFESIRVEAELKKDSLWGLSEKIANIARCYSNLAQKRTKYEKGGY